MALNKNYWLRSGAYLFCNSMSRKEHLANGGGPGDDIKVTYGNLRIHVFIFIDDKLQLLTPDGGGKAMAPILHFSKDIDKEDFNHCLRDKVLHMLKPAIDAGKITDVKIIDENFAVPLVLRRGNNIRDETWEEIGLRPLEIAVIVMIGSDSILPGEITLRDLDGRVKLWSCELPPLDPDDALQARRDGELSEELLPADVDRVFDRLEEGQSSTNLKERGSSP